MVNEYYLRAKETYLYANVITKTRAFLEANSEAELIDLHVGDVSLPLTHTVKDALVEAAEKMAKKETFHGYGPEQGYPFLRESIARYYASLGAKVSVDEIFVSEGAKSDITEILELFSPHATTVIPTPSHTAFADANRMANRRVFTLSGNKENGFLPLPHPDMAGDILYLCSPCNPTGAAYTREALQVFVDFANKNGAVILYNAAYEAFLRESDLPRSIYEIPGAERCAIEVCSLSKTAGFTGMRCGYTVVPRTLLRDDTSLWQMWLRNRAVKHNGVSYPVQCAAAAALSGAGLMESAEQLTYYLENAEILAETLTKHGIYFTGGKHAPYLWFECPSKLRSWEFFDLALEKAGVIGTPGVCFGADGEGFFRLCAFGDRESIKRSAARLDALFLELEGSLS